VFGNVKNGKKYVDIQELAISGSADRPNIFCKYWKEEPNIWMQKYYWNDVIVKKNIKISRNNTLDNLVKEKTLPFCLI